MSTVALDGVTLRLGGGPGGRTVLQDVSFSLGANEFVGLLGANGAGKTTLLRALLGLVPPAAGRIEVLGAPVRPGQAGIGYMPQHHPAGPALRLRGRDVVAAVAGGTRRGLPWPNAAERADVAQAIEWVGAEALADRPLGELSGGQRQRLLLAQALLGRPRLLLLDEPLAGLDPPGQQQIVALVRRLQQQLGFTALFSAHELTPVLPAMDRVLYLAGGKAAIGRVDQVVTSASLSRLYGAPIEVVQAAGRVFVLPAVAA